VAVALGGDEHIRLSRDEIQRDLSTQSSGLLQRAQSIDRFPRPLGIDLECGDGFWSAGPANRHGQMAALEIPLQALPQIGLERRQVSGKLCREVEVAMVDAADLDPEPAPGDIAISLSKARHAERHSLE